MERKDIAKAKGEPLVLMGQEIKEGDKAPDFRLLDQDSKEVGLSDFRGKIKLVSVAGSLDTSVCDLQLRRFNQEASDLGDDVVVLNISVDLPPAIKRFCTAAGIERAVALSDHRDVSFGTSYGVLIKGLRLLYRSIFVIDQKDVVRYVQYSPDMGTELDYDDAIKAAKWLLATAVA